MSRATSDDQLKFLLSCVRHSNAGKIDFVEVARECGVVSKGAAAKRYERLLKANGIHPSGGLTEKSQTPALKPKTRTEIAKAAAAKRRKIEGDSFGSMAEDEDDHNPYLKVEHMDATSIKPEPDTGFNTLPYQHMTVSQQRPFFPRLPAPPMLMHHPFAQSYQTMHQPQQHPFPPPVQQPLHSSISRQTQQPIPNMSTSTPQLAMSHSRPASSVPEEHIQSMFDEFCSQDMFRQSDFGAPPRSTSATATNTTSSMTASAAVEPHVSSHAADTTSVSTTQPQQIEANVKVEPDSNVPPATIVEEPKGSGFQDCIVITD